MTPITREEHYLAKLCGEDVNVPIPVTRKEIYYYKICGYEAETPEPITREEFYLAKIVGMDVAVPKPVTRIEYYLAALAGEDVNVPAPITRKERYLYAWLDGGEVITLTGTSPLSLLNALAKPIKSLIQHGKCTVSGSDITCNNGVLSVENDEIVVTGTPEEIVVSASGADDQTATAENLFSVDDIADTQDIISGTVTRRCEAVVSDGTTPSGRYIGTVGEGNILVCAKETGYTGAIASFEADKVEPLNGLVCEINPVQDLHGYDAPWPAGGGANILDPNIKYTTQTVNDVILTTIDGYNFVLNGTSNAAGSLGTNTIALADAVILPPGTYYANAGRYALYSETDTFIKNQYGGTSFSVDEPFYVRKVVFEFNSGRTFNNDSRFIGLTKGSTGLTSWSPYTNICPISGHTGVDVTQTGKSILEFDKETITVDTNMNGYAGWNYSGWKIQDRTKKYTYSVYIDNTNAVDFSRVGVWFKGADNATFVDGTNSFGNNIAAGNTGWSTITIDPSTLPNTYYLYFGLSLKKNGVASYPMVEVVNTRTTYHAYTGTTIPITFPDGQTVYGGQDEVVSGALVSTMGMVDLGTLNWTKDNGYKRFYASLTDAKTTSSNVAFNAISSMYKAIPFNDLAFGDDGIMALSTGGNISVRNLGLFDKTAGEFKTAMSGVQLCYELATSVLYHLDSIDPIIPYIGQNNIWHDGNGDTTAYVSDGITEEKVAPQRLTTSEGDNTITVTAEVEDIVFDVTYVMEE